MIDQSYIITYDNSTMKNSSISEKLRKLRRECGFSLSELARITDTSPATLSRYENGWTRFEVSTLKKLAMAMKCKLSIEFISKEENNQTRKSELEVINSLGRLFWDSEFNCEILEKYPVWVVERVLESGQLEDIHSLQLLMGYDKFLESILKTTRLSQKTWVFWNNILRKEGMPCMKRSSRETALNF